MAEACRRLDLHHSAARKVMAVSGVRARQFKGFPPRFHAGDIDRINRAAIGVYQPPGGNGAA